MIVNATELKANLGKYLKATDEGNIVITKNGKPVALLEKITTWEEAGIIREGAPDYSYDHKRMTYEDFIEMYENTDGRYEYIDGIVYAMASPTYEHQRVIWTIMSELDSYFNDKMCNPVVAPLDIYLKFEDRQHVVQPDLFVICDHVNLKDGKYYGVPTLIIEVLSPSTRNKDLIEKLNLYVQAG